MRPIHALCLALFALTATAAEARNRSTELLREQFRQQGLSESMVYNNVYFFSEGWEDRELLSGLWESRGAFTSRGRPPVSLFGIRLFNETNLRICFRAKARLLTGALIGTPRNGRLSVNGLLEPGRNDVVLVHTMQADLINEDIGTATRAYYLWLAAPAGAERPCAATAPADLEDWLAKPLDEKAGFIRKATPELRNALSLAPRTLPIPAMLRAPGTARLK